MKKREREKALQAAARPEYSSPFTIGRVISGLSRTELPILLGGSLRSRLYGGSRAVPRVRSRRNWTVSPLSSKRRVANDRAPNVSLGANSRRALPRCIPLPGKSLFLARRLFARFRANLRLPVARIALPIRSNSRFAASLFVSLLFERNSTLIPITTDKTLPALPFLFETYLFGLMSWKEWHISLNSDAANVCRTRRYIIVCMCTCGSFF